MLYFPPVETPLVFATRLAQRTGKLLLEYYGEATFQTSLKPDRTVVTEVDLIADRLIAQAIRERFPEDVLISEELQPVYATQIRSATPGSQAEPAVWVIDPIDGTTNFSLGLHYWGVLIARLVNGWPETGVMYFPLINELYTAQRGEGAFFNGKRLQIQSLNPYQTATFFSCCSHTHRRYQVSVPYKTRILGSAGYSLCSVARGVALVSFEATPKVWDIAAGWLLVSEAGGTVETLDGSQPFPLQPGIEYASQSYPTLSAATPEIAARARLQIVLK
jgi:myo-inositol-1(or 4)-monophosphatase